MKRSCPDIEELEKLVEQDSKKVIKHASNCLGCQAVLALIADRHAEIETPDCAKTEVLAVARASLSDADRRSLEEHLSRCESCRLLWEHELP